MLGDAADPIWAALTHLTGAMAVLAGEPDEWSPADLDHGRVRYHGEPLTPAEADEVRLYIDWLRSRRSLTAGTARPPT